MPGAGTASSGGGGAVDVEAPTVQDLPGESADHLLDRILRNALGDPGLGEDKTGGVKKEEPGVKSETGVKTERVKTEIKAEPLDAPALPAIDSGRRRSRDRRKRSRSRGRKKRSRSRRRRHRSRSRRRRRR